MRSGAVLLAATALALGGCSDEPEDELRASGPLAAGFEIEPGSALVGAVFPVGDEGLRAVLQVDGDMEEVFEGYVRQADELGFPVAVGPARPDGQLCTDDTAQWYTTRSDAEAYELECVASGSGENRWSMELRGLAGADGQGYLEIVGGTYAGTSASPPPVADGPVAPTTDDELVPELAVPEDDPPLRLVEGSELIGEPLPATCATGGFVAVLRVTGELLPVMRGYAGQIAAMRAFGSDGLVGGEDEPSVRASAAGGGDLSVLGAAGDPSHILVDRCND